MKLDEAKIMLKAYIVMMKQNLNSNPDIKPLIEALEIIDNHVAQIENENTKFKKKKTLQNIGGYEKH